MKIKYVCKTLKIRKNKLLSDLIDSVMYIG